MFRRFLSSVQSPSDLRSMIFEELLSLTDEIREEIIEVVAKREGHLGASLGVVELTVALHYVFNTPHDRLIWDVGHQAYGHKMITGRRKDFASLRQLNGLSGFPKQDESPYDNFGTGHSSTSLSAILGMALASAQKGEDRQHIAVIGDASIASGMAFEALNHLGTTQANVLIILNDNSMGIDPSVGALKHFFQSVDRMHPDEKNIFDLLNIAYSGPFDGHNLAQLISAMEKQKRRIGPRILHIRTTKGKGLAEAEKNQIQFHAPGKFDPLTGKLNKPLVEGKTKFQTVVGKTLEDLFAQNNKLIAITPAMPTGSGLTQLMQKYPDRCLDVGIAEQHAVTLAAGMATEGFLPLCVIYSTFLQRAYDQLIHDVALQNLHVIFCIDRAGLVGHDGPTHHGVFDIPFLRTIPNITLLAPRDEIQLRNSLFTLQKNMNGPVAIRYPRGYGINKEWEVPFETIDIGRLTPLKEGKRIAVISVGTTAEDVRQALPLLSDPTEVAHFDLGCVKPLDTKRLIVLFKQFDCIVTIEDGAIAGGAGTAIMECAHQHGFSNRVISLGIPDNFVSQGAVEILKEKLEIDAQGIANTLTTLLSN